MKIFEIYIKSHTDAPDFEMEIGAPNKKEAVEFFYYRLRGEFDRKFISKNIQLLTTRV